MRKLIFVLVVFFMVFSALRTPNPMHGTQGMTTSATTMAPQVAFQTPVRDISHECRQFQEEAQYARDQADRARSYDLRHGWEENQSTAENAYRSLCQ